MTKVTIRIDPGACISAANCVGVSPKLFTLTSGYAEILDSNGANRGASHTFEATAAELELIEEAVESCPTRAIAITIGG